MIPGNANALPPLSVGRVTEQATLYREAAQPSIKLESVSDAEAGIAS